MEIHGERQIECNDWTFFGPPDLQMAINTVNNVPVQMAINFKQCRLNVTSFKNRPSL